MNIGTNQTVVREIFGREAILFYSHQLISRMQGWFWTLKPVSK